MSGTITGITNHGTLFQVDVKSDDPDHKGYVRTVFMDHRMFHHMYEGEEGRIVGRPVEILGDRFVDERINFLDKEED